MSDIDKIAIEALIEVVEENLEKVLGFDVEDIRFLEDAFDALNQLKRIIF